MHVKTFRIILAGLPETSVKFRCGFRELNAQMPKRKKDSKNTYNVLDIIFEKRGPGRPPSVCAASIRGRADNYRSILSNVWDQMWPLLSRVRTEDDVIKAFHEGASTYEREFMPARASFVLKILQEEKFPRRRQTRINFLADSLAGLELVSARRSRDICASERADAKLAHHIVRYEFYIECSCGYQGTSRDHACPECGAQIFFGLGSHL
jgi:hypothetical protein